MPSSNPPSHALAELGKLDRYAGMEFIKPTSKLNRRYVGPGAEFNTGEYETKKVVIRDARNHDEHFSIDTTGFFLAKHQSKVENWSDAQQLADVYMPEIHKFVKDLTGGDEVIIFGPVLRRVQSGPMDASINPVEQPPAFDVHVDYTARRANALADNLLKEQGTGKREDYRRIMMVNFWRAVSPGPQNWPLALIDGASVRDSEGIINELVYTDNIPARDQIPPTLPFDPMYPEGTLFLHQEWHRWFYFSNMTRDELLVFRLYDSDEGNAWRVPHCSFFNEQQGAITRQSVEIRAAVYFK